MSKLTRREWCGLAPAALALSAAAPPARAAVEAAKGPYRYCLNTGTIIGHSLSLPETVDLVAEAGYDGLEPWIREIDRFEKGGGDLGDLAKRIADKGLIVESAIGFSEWIVDDPGRRKKGFEDAKRSMELVKRIGGSRIAAPPAGATDKADLDLFRVAERYRTLLEAGDSIGVVPQLEVWGFSRALGKLSEVMMVAVESGHPKALVLPDIYHLYKGGSDFAGLRLISGHAMQVFHVNDYPADPPRATITDADRVYPGDGVAPVPRILADIASVGFKGALSLELFNRTYWKQDPRHVLRVGLEKMRSAVQKSA